MTDRRHDRSSASHGVSRREFLEAGAIGGLAAAAGVRLPNGRGPTDAPPSPVSRLTSPAFELEEVTIAELQRGMQSGKWTARSICELYLQRIEAMDKNGPELHAVIETNPDALAIADQLDAERTTKGARGPMHGIPVLIKDNVGTADKMETTAGSLALVGAKPSKDAFIVQRMRAAGAVIIGKANLSEWANFRSTHSSSGWSGRGGQCKNPYALDRNPCGSSSGTGAGISANFAAVGIGTETDGSIVCPSSANSVVGIKPTVGLVSRGGVIPISHNQDTAGPMARTVADAATLLSVLTGVDPDDPFTAGSKGHVAADYTKFLDPNGLKGARIGVARRNFFGYHAATDRIVEAAIEVMRGLGAVIVDPADIPHVGEYDDTENIVLQYDFKHDIAAYLRSLGSATTLKTLADLIAFNEAHKLEEMPYFGQEEFLRSEKRGVLTDPEYVNALDKNHRLARTEGIDAVMQKYKLDAIVAPTGNPPWMTDLVNGDHFLGGSSTPAAVAGYTSVGVPAGYDFGLPVNISFIGGAYSEPTLIRLAYAYEQAAKPRRAPQFLATADLTVR